MSSVCEICGKDTKFNYSSRTGLVCKDCAKEELVTNKSAGDQITKITLPKFLSAAGVIFFVLNLIGSIYVYFYYALISLGIALIFSGSIIMLICFGLSKIIKQNIFIIKNSCNNSMG